jgi:hypothetical protein
VSSSASAIVTRPISRAVTSARRRLSCSSARRKIVRGWPCEVDVPHLRGRDGEESLERHSPTRGGGSPKAPAGQAAFSPRRLFRGSDPSQLSHLVIPVARRSKSGPELVCMPLQTPGERAGSPPKRAGNVTPTGEAAELTCREDLVSRGPAFGPCGWPNASGGERMAAAPALAHFCHCAATRSSGPSSDLLRRSSALRFRAA